MRERKLHDIAALSEQVAREGAARPSQTLVGFGDAEPHRPETEAPARFAQRRANIRQMSQKEKQALQRKLSQEQQLDVAISELRKLTKGNTEGASFSTKRPRG